MQAKVRYLLVAVCTALTLLFFYGTFRGPHPDGDRGLGGFRDLPSQFLQNDDIHVHDTHLSARTRREVRKRTTHRECRMENCFDFSRCKSGFKVYVYPAIQDKISKRYADILSVLRTSRYSTSDPSEACLFVLSLDTLDRDKLSNEDYVHLLSKKITSLSLWNSGQNHVVFNLYSGTWEHYYEDDLGFDPGKAILAKASLSDSFYRPGFDISYPLIGKDHPLKGGDSGYLTANTVPPVRKYMLSFKGKRYLVGIGSESRDALYHIHNSDDIILLTTCQHGNLPKDKRDKRCKTDEEEYDKWDFKTLLHNSTFCLVPRGRRLGSYRFLEALQAACIPVLLSNQWVLPFSEVIDWNKAAIWADERLLLQVPSIVRSISHTEILSVRQHSQFLWDTYFSSTEKIVHTTLEIVKERISKHFSIPSRTPVTWNSQPGGLANLPEFSQEVGAYPHQLVLSMGSPEMGPQSSFSLESYGPVGLADGDGVMFTAVIYCSTSSSSVMPTSPLNRLVKNLAKSQYLDKILILWHSDTPPPDSVRWPVTSKVQLFIKVIESINQRFYPYEEITTAAVLNVDEDIVLLTDEADFAFHVWQHFPQRIVGYPSRTHFWDETRGRWAYTSKWTNDYSMVLTSAAFYHKYYGYYYHQIVPSFIMDTVHHHSNCEDILMNFIVSHVTKLPPIKVAQRKRFKETSEVSQDSKETKPQSGWLTAEHFQQRQTCMNIFKDYFGYMPLQRSEMRFDPLLYKDPVSMARKKYRQFEHL